MNKKISIIFIILGLISCIPFNEVKAQNVANEESYKNSTAYINGNEIPFYVTANESKMINGWFIFDMADGVTILDDKVVTSTVSGCKNGFYNVGYIYSGKEYKGYVCADYLIFNVEINNYKEEFIKNNIPEIYWEGLAILKKAYPNWTFIGIDTNLEWDKVISSESIVGKSLIQITNKPLSDEDKALLSLDGGSYDATTNTFLYNKNEGTTWYYPNKNTVAYYMDPRNFFNERSIFMFESLHYNNYAKGDELNTTEEETYSLLSIKSMLKNTGLAEYAEKFEMAGVRENVNSVSLAARSKQEVSKGDGTLSGSIQKTEEKDETGNVLGLYNFFNIYAYANAFPNCDSAVGCAIEYAKRSDWTTPEKAILGGAKFIADNYINKGQDTGYFQKWDVIDGGNGLYTHQYMTNVEAPLSEASKTYNSYNDEKILDRKFTFYIPIYKNMPDKVAVKPTEVDKDKMEEIKENIKEEENKLSIGEIVVGAGYKNNAGYLTNIGVSTTALGIKNKLLAMSKDAIIKITFNNVEVSNETIIGTGYVIEITNGKNTGKLTTLYYGDLSGDGKINVLDLLKVQRNILGAVNLNESEKKAADVNKDGKINVLDLLLIQKNILGKAEIGQ